MSQPTPTSPDLQEIIQLVSQETRKESEQLLAEYDEALKEFEQKSTKAT